MRCVDAKLLTVQQCATLGAFSLSTGNRLRNEWIEHGGALGPPKLGSMAGRPRSMSSAAVEAIADMLKVQEDLSLRDIQELLVRLGYERFSLSLLSRQLKRMGLSRKDIARPPASASASASGSTSRSEAPESSQSGSLARSKANGMGQSNGAPSLSRHGNQ